MQAERKGKKKTVFLPFPEAQPILGEAKDSASRVERKEKTLFSFLSRAAACLGQKQSTECDPAETEAKKRATQTAATPPEALCAIWQTVKADGVAVRLLGVGKTPARGDSPLPWDVSLDPSHGNRDPWDVSVVPWDVSDEKIPPICDI